MGKDLRKDYYLKEYIEFLGDIYIDFRKTRAPIEAGFAKKVLRIKKGEKILDLCCGMGHNSVYLAKQGIQVVGVDYSHYSIKKARELMAREGVEILFWEGDAREIPWVEEFDAVVMLFNSFGYSEEDEENLKILKNIASVLKSRGRFFIEVMNRDFAVVLAKKGSDEFKVSNGYHQQVFYQFDPKNGIFRIKRIVFKTEGKREFKFSQRAYTYSELNYLMGEVGLKITGAYGGYEGDSFTLDSQSLIVIGNKR